jgi:cytochrome c553
MRMFVGVCFGLAPLLVARSSAQEAPQAYEFFETKVRPLLAARCYDCHGPDKQRSGLRTDGLDALLVGGSRGPAIVPGSPESSLLVRAVRGDEPEFRMPPLEELTTEEITLLETWIAQGAPGPRDTKARTVETFDLLKRRGEHWGFRPITKPAPPQVADKAWSEKPIDAFIAAALERADLTPKGPADRRTLLRRAAFDLVGLPPTPDELAVFEADASPGAFERQIDRLLASPRFGERWGRHWLDLVRYAETKGHEFDYLIANAWQYRDYVIRAFNQDVAYDRFVREHVAGDLLPEPRPHRDEGWDESVLGTGFWFFGEEKHSPVDIRADQTERIANQIDVFSKTFLGLTVACARCHDHKFEAISARDYYALSGYLLSSSYRQVRFQTRENNARIAQELARLEERHRAQVVRATGAALEQSLAGTARAMLAAREVEHELLGDAGVGGEKPPDTWPAARTVVVERVSERTSVPTARIEAWIDAFARVRADKTPILLPWVQGEGIQPLLTRELQAARASPDQTVAIADFARSEAEDWIQDGFCFSRVEAGFTRLGTDPRQPLARLFAYAGAASDPIWDRLVLAPQTERVPGRVDWVQSGRMLRTETIRLEHKNLFYLVQGGGRAFLEVDGHRMIEGPLHGGTVFSWKDEGRRWIRHELEDYLGHTAHVEFSPQGDGSELVIERVIGSDEEPPALGSDTDWLIHALAGADPDDAEALAQRYEELFLFVAARLRDGRLTGQEAGPGFAILGWLLDNPGLLASPLDTSGVRAALLPYLERRVELLSSLRLESATAPALFDANGVDEHLLLRGDSHQPQGVVARNLPEALRSPEESGSESKKGSGRLALAQRLTDPETNPYLARVWVNRIWHHIFGRGIVPSVDNLGISGDEPTHPELLDHLAATLIEQDFSTKRLLKQILLSRTYRQGSQPSPRAREFDPENRLLHHYPLQRLDAEVLRDTLLSVAGNLNQTPYGPPVPLHLTSFLDGRGRPGTSGPLDGDGRRSVYLAVRRNFLMPFFQVFDYPTPFTTQGRRGVSNVPAQALTLWNDPFVIGQAERWAEAVYKSHATDDERIETIYLTALGRPPEEDELKFAGQFLDEHPEEAAQPLAELCHVLFNTKEFLFVD